MTHGFDEWRIMCLLHVFVLWGNEHALKTWTLDLLYLWCRISVSRWSDWDGYEDISAQDDEGLSFYTFQINNHLRQEQTKPPNKAERCVGSVYVSSDMLCHNWRTEDVFPAGLIKKCCWRDDRTSVHHDPSGFHQVTNNKRFNWPRPLKTTLLHFYFLSLYGPKCI